MHLLFESIAEEIRTNKQDPAPSNQIKKEINDGNPQVDWGTHVYVQRSSGVATSSCAYCTHCMCMRNETSERHGLPMYVYPMELSPAHFPSAMPSTYVAAST